MTNEVDPMVGQVVENRYLIEAALGSGGMGAVYRARHVKVGREVAIKILHDHLVTDPAMVQRFEREAALVAKLDHKNIVSVIDVGETASKQKLMVLELARGETLAELITREGPLARSRVIAIVRQLLQGLDHAHGAGLIHRDLKPENVIIERDHHGSETPKLVDFGIAVLRDDHHVDRRFAGTCTVLGTPEFMAPEQAQGAELDARCDLFALGVMMYVMLAGRLPFDGTGIEVAIANISKNPPPIAARSPGVTVDPLLEVFARRLMARRLAARMPSARTALRLLDLVDTDPVAATKLLMPQALITKPTEPMAPIRRTRDVTPAPMPSAPVQAAPAITVSMPRRQRLAGLLALAIGAATAVVTMCLAVSAATSRPVAATPEVIYTPVEEPSIAIRFVVNERAADDIVLHEGEAQGDIVGAREAVPRTMRRRPRPQLASPSVERRDETVAPPARATELSANTVAERYLAVGRLLADAPSAEALRVRYRRIHLMSALATEAGRREAVAALDWIAGQLR